MSEDATKQVRELVNAFDLSKARQIFATLICLPGDFDAAKAALHDAFARSDRAMGTLWRVGRLAIRAFTNVGLCLERSAGSPLGGRFFHLLPMVRRVPGYRQNTIGSQPTKMRALKTRIAVSIA